MKTRHLLFLLTVMLVVAAGCAKKHNHEEPLTIPKNAAKLEVAFSWKGIEPCTPDSPEIRVSGIPVGTQRLMVKLKNISDAAWNQGGGDIEHDGSGVIPAKALDIGYNGPCPPPDQRQKFEIWVMATDEQKAIIAFGKLRKVYPPKE